MKPFGFLLICIPIGVQAQEVTVAQGHAAWARIYEITSHPRCTNCHVDESGRPGWAGLGYGADQLHGMNITAGDSRIGAESIPCRACHIGAAGANGVAHAAPQVEDAWRLPPVELAWQGKTSAEVCAQLRNPDTNDGFDVAALGEHIRESAFVNWGFAPGAGRDAAPGSAKAMADDVLLWGAAGAPCEGDL